MPQTTEVVDPVPGAGAPHLPQQPDLVQLLTPEGDRVEHPDYAIDISDDELRSLYRDLALVRRWDVEATALQRQGELGIWASLLGQEAAQVGAGRALQPQDMAFPTYREHGVAWTRGVDPLHVISLFRGVDNGGWDPIATGFNLYRSEERRVGKEGRSRWAPYPLKKKLHDYYLAITRQKAKT